MHCIRIHSRLFTDKYVIIMNIVTVLTDSYIVTELCITNKNNGCFN